MWRVHIDALVGLDLGQQSNRWRQEEIEDAGEGEASFWLLPAV
jgi:hypothetical protein